MAFGSMRPGRYGAPGRAERFLAGMIIAALAASIIGTAAGLAQARMNAADRERYEQSRRVRENRIYQFFGWYHSVGQLLLHVSNLGYFGDWDADLAAPSAEWPAGSGNEYLYAAGLWVGGVVRNDITGAPDTLVSAAVYQQEFRPNPEDLLLTIYETWEGAANSGRLADDDGDCLDHVFDEDDPFKWYDEDPLDGRDNDDDGLIDEDYAAISQQMYRMEYEDTYEEDVNENAPAGDEHRSLGLRVIQESYQWTSELTDDFVGIDFTVVNIGEDTINMAYVGFMVDADAGPLSDEILNYVDDRGGFIDTLVISVNPNDPTEVDTLDMTIAYMFDDPYGEDGNIAKGYFGCMFMGHPTSNADTLLPDQLPNAPVRVRVHAFEIWSSGTEDPNNDRDRYRYLRGVADYPLLDGFDNDIDGEVDEDDEWRVNIDRDADAPLDWRFMLSAGPFRQIMPGDTLSFQYAFVMGQGLEGMLTNAATAQQIYNGIWQEIPNCAGEPESALIHWVADTPPPPPNQEITAGDGFVRIEWDDFPETVEDPLTRIRDFYGYQVWKAVGWTRESSEPKDQDWQLILDIDRGDGGAELDEWDTGLEGIGKYAFVDNLVKNGFSYWYSVTAYDSTGEGYHFGKFSQNKTLVVPNSGVRSTLDEVRVVPNPYVNHEYLARWNLAPNELDPTGEKLCFQNLPRDSVVRIYSLGGELVETLRPEAESTGGDACWNMISRNSQIVVSGVYLYHVDSPLGEKIGKFVIIK
jgi:hypothetical protein